jgi:hypothetical protein
MIVMIRSQGSEPAFEPGRLLAGGEGPGWMAGTFAPHPFRLVVHGSDPSRTPGASCCYNEGRPAATTSATMSHSFVPPLLALSRRWHHSRCVFVRLNLWR